MSMLPRIDCEGFHRRDFLKIGTGAGLLGLSLPDLLRLEAQSASTTGAAKRAHAVIMVWLAGGPATIDMWDLKPDAPEGIRGDFKVIETRAKGVQISEHMPKLAGVADRVTLVRSLQHSIPAHGPATVFMTTGNKPTPAIQYPSLGSLASKLLPADKAVPSYVSFSDIRGGTAGQAGYLGTAHNPFLVEGNGAGGKGGSKLSVRGLQLPAEFGVRELENREKFLNGIDGSFRKFDGSTDLVDGMEAFHKQALDILRSDKTKKAFDLDREPARLRERYGNNNFGTSALAARRLVEAGVRFITISLGGWDTHGKNFESLAKKLLPQLDVALAALLVDLDERGMLDRTLVYCAGEFGRTPKINKNAGRDHWARSMAVLLAGGGLKRGYVYGSTDPEGMAPATNPCTPDDVSSTLFHCLGIDPHKELTSPTGRPIQLFREGAVIENILA
ncbi:MAG: DUF1501 domain-containing protein [Gemmataceae bacterium]